MYVIPSRLACVCMRRCWSRGSAASCASRPLSRRLHSRGPVRPGSSHTQPPLPTAWRLHLPCLARPMQQHSRLSRPRHPCPPAPSHQKTTTLQLPRPPAPEQQATQAPTPGQAKPYAHHPSGPHLSPAPLQLRVRCRPPSAHPTQPSWRAATTALQAMAATAAVAVAAAAAAWQVTTANQRRQADMKAICMPQKARTCRRPCGVQTQQRWRPQHGTQRLGCGTTEGYALAAHGWGKFWGVGRQRDVLLLCTAGAHSWGKFRGVKE